MSVMVVEQQMKVCFLLGSGLSRPASFPCLEQIGSRVLSGDNIVKISGVYHEKQPSACAAALKDEELERVLRFLHWLEVMANLRFETTPHRANYEDLFYLASQIHYDILGEYENPAVRPFIRDALFNLCESIPASAVSLDQLGDLAGETTNYIRDVVALMLTKPPGRTEYLKLFLDAAHDSTVSALNLFTLNHDKLLEGYFHNKIHFIDGFGEEDSLRRIRRWSPTLFDATVPGRGVAAVRLFKLHGSIDWHRFRPRQFSHVGSDSNPWNEEYVGIGSNPALEVEGHCLILVGTFNKMIDYTDAVFFEMHHRLMCALAEAERLIVCGYGFGDKGINKRITEWMCLSSTRKILVIDPKTPDKLKEFARRAIETKIAGWKRKGRWIHWDKGLDAPEITWDRIAKDFIRADNHCGANRRRAGGQRRLKNDCRPSRRRRASKSTV
jgi:hypothetical protein